MAGRVDSGELLVAPVHQTRCVRNSPLPSVNASGKAGSEGAGPNLLDKRGVLEEDSTRSLVVRIEDADLELQLPANDPDWLEQVGVVGDENGRVKTPQMSIVHEMGGEIDVGALLLGLGDLDELGPVGIGFSQEHHDIVGQERAVNDLKPRQRTEGSEVDLLTSGFVRIVLASAHPSGKVPDSLDGMSGKKELGKASDVEPLVRSAPYGPVVEVEAVHVHVGANGHGGDL